MRVCECSSACDAQLHDNYPSRYKRSHAPQRVTPAATDPETAVEVDCSQCGLTWVVSPVVANVIRQDRCSKCWIKRAKKERKARRKKT